MNEAIDKAINLAKELSDIDRFESKEIKIGYSSKYTVICTGHNDYILLYCDHVSESGPRSKIIEYLMGQ